MACPFEEVGRGQAGNLTLPSGMVLPVIAVHCPNGASSRGFASSTERVAVGWCFGCGLAWLVLGFSFWRSNTILCERVALGQAQIKIAILPPFLAIELHFVRKGCNGNPEMAILPQFLAIEPQFVRKGSPSLLQIATLLQFLAIEPHFVRKVAPDALQIATLPQFLAIEHRFVRKGCVSCRLVGTAPRLKREIKKKERARGQESKRECEDVRM